MWVRRWLDAAGIHDPVLRQCYTRCVRDAADLDGGNVRWWGLRSVPAAVRPHVAAMAAVSAEADRRADTGSVDQRKRRFDEYVEAVLAAVASGGSGDPVLHAVASTFGTFRLPDTVLRHMFAAMRRDIGFVEFATYEELRQWARLSSGGAMVGMMTLLEGLEVARELEPVLYEYGELAQFMDQLADLADDLGDGRMYLPLADLDRFGVRAEDVKARRWTPGMADLLEFEVERITSRMPALVAEQQRHTDSPLPGAFAAHCDLMLREVLADGPAVLERASRARLADRLDIWLPVWRSTIPC
ncbi:phytoene/squalene synthase family protein [Allokutzneria albata]|uniref:Farnesyl-diphosphate farnesyltransferase n=1 Tax=Allokutzneria albata TaxID=211114 RepID=A0A1G9SJG9_ALLAB|nr:squalene/phytoene synthase family protein [Allokutzneria albata]SDM34915.1 farnesyl-diphosphate farnesyltransferase [Allokutzneria albata]